MHKIICVIPAKKKSRRLKGKNFKPLFNKPLVFWTLNFASNLKFVDKIVLTSDSQEILKIAKPFNKITGLMRDKKLARDNTLMWDVVKDVIDKYNANDFHGILLLQPTTPYRSIIKFNYYLKYFKKKLQNYYSVSTTTKTNHPCYLEGKKLFFRKKGKKCYQTGSLILLSMKSFLKKKSFRINNSKPIIINKDYENFDIDNNSDFMNSHSFFKNNKKFKKYFLCKNLL